VTVSIDGDVYSGQSVDGLMRSGDGAFYEAKARCRNQVVFAERTG
jgi:hypothetical protein